MIVFDHISLPNVDLSRHLREVLRLSMGMYICVHNHHSEITLICRVFQNRLLIANETRGMAVYST